MPTAHGSKYLQRMCKHRSHRLDVSFDAQEGTVRFPEAVATMTADAHGLRVAVEGEQAVS